MRASHAAFVLKLLGYSDVAVYDGSMGEWANLEETPIEKDGKITTGVKPVAEKAPAKAKKPARKPVAKPKKPARPPKAKKPKAGPRKAKKGKR